MIFYPVAFFLSIPRGIKFSWNQKSNITISGISTGYARGSTGRDIFLAPQGAFRALEARATSSGSGGMLPQEIFEKEHSETLFPAFLETKYQFPKQGWSSLKFSLKVNYSMEMDKW